MARLNEPPQPSVESIDALKRRFVRQNREIARANSTQSLRIRNLESEVSRLLSENVSLREQIIKLHYEIEKSTSQSIQDNVDIVKAKLEDKLTELGGLLKELGQVQKTNESRSIQKKANSRSSPKRSPDQRSWKNALTLAEATGGGDGRLPPIVEDKYYPRRTMDAEELLGVFTDPANVTDSPDLGPPPVAHFDEGDPIKFDPKPGNSATKASSKSRKELQPPFPVTLETRKKRRESSHHRDIEDQRLSAEAGSGEASKDTARSIDQPLKTGAKRKLNVRDEEDQAGTFSEQGKEVYHFRSKSAEPPNCESVVTVTKPTLSRTSKPARDSVTQTAAVNLQSHKEKATETSTTAATTNRKALGPKSVNMDLINSPVKLKDNGKQKVTQAKDELAKIVRERNQQKEKAQSGKPMTHAKNHGPAATGAALKTIDPPPKTPAPPDDLFSPISSEPSAARAESRDTPPPPDLGPDTGTGSFGRASRRSKGSVNYAQPNLRDKMRRPTSELVDAVGAEERLRQASLAKVKPEKPALAEIKIEEDTDALPIWKMCDLKGDQRTREEPTSPLNTKTGGSAVDSAGSIHAKQRIQGMMPSHSDGTNDQSRLSGAASAIAALTAGSHRSKKREEDRSSVTAMGEKGSREPEEKLSIFDFTGSSPADTGGDISDKDVTDKSRKIRSSRRHSSVAASSDQGPGSLSISRRVERRRDSVLSKGREEMGKTGIGSQLSRTKSVLDLGTGNEETSSARVERAASRRRSMML